MTQQNAEKIGSFVGRYLRMETSDKFSFKLRKYLCVRVEVDITQPLKTGFFLSRGRDTMVWIQFQFERLNDFCYVCGKLGHGNKNCDIVIHTDDVLDPGWLMARGCEHLLQLSVLLGSCH